MTRTFDTTPEQDAAIAWRVAQINLTVKTPITENDLVAQYAGLHLVQVMRDYLEAEGERIYNAVKTAATMKQLADVKAVLGL